MFIGVSVKSLDDVKQAILTCKERGDSMASVVYSVERLDKSPKSTADAMSKVRMLS
jgi:hypothetical protein